MRNVSRVVVPPVVLPHQVGRSSGPDFADELDMPIQNESEHRSEHRPAPVNSYPPRQISAEQAVCVVIPPIMEIGVPTSAVASGARMVSGIAVASPVPGSLTATQPFAGVPVSYGTQPVVGPLSGDIGLGESTPPMVSVSNPAMADSPVFAPPFVQLDEVGALIQTESMQQLDVAVQPTGITEALLGSRVFGVHLLASTYLSELRTSAGQTGPAELLNAMPSEAEDMVAGTYDASSGMPHVTAAAMVGAPPQDEAAEAFGFFAWKTVEAARDEFRSSAEAKNTPEASQELLWPEDSLRLTKQLDGSLTLWLRDYRMDDKQVTYVVGTLVNEAGSREMHLGRIFLNGREVWTSPNKY